MKRTLFLPLALLALATAACASQPTDGTAKKVTQKGEYVTISEEVRQRILSRGENPDEEVCRREEKAGSTIPMKICATKAAWEAKADASKEGTRDIQNKSLQTAAPNAG